MLGFAAQHPTVSCGTERSHLPPLHDARVTKSCPDMADCHQTPLPAVHSNNKIILYQYLTFAIPDPHPFDVFISHTSEDKDEVVRPLAIELRGAGLSVWYDEFELRIGDSLRRKIDKGLANSRFGVVVLSRAFFGRGWPEYELDGLVTRTVSGDQVLLPVWHNVTKREVMDYSPSLADRVARSTATHTVEEIAAEIVDVIHNPPER